MVERWQPYCGGEFVNRPELPTVTLCSAKSDPLPNQSTYHIPIRDTVSQTVTLGLATVMQWRLTDKHTSSRRGQPTVRCSFASAGPSETERVACAA